MTPTVLFIAGLERSGSTLVDRLLGEVPGFCSVGELVFLWDRGLREGERCGCGRPLPECPFWTEVGERAFGGWSRLDLEGISRLQRRVDRNRYVPLLLVPRSSAPYTERARRYAETIGRVYGAIAAASGADVIVDTSKHVSTLALLRTVPGVDVRVVHLVRDPHGVAFSLQKVVPRPEVEDRPAYMHRLAPWRASARWVGYNTSIDVVRRGRPGMLLRYEDLVSRPTDVLAELVRLAGRPPADLSFVGHDEVALTTTHTVSGNPARFERSIAIRPDEQWRRSMPAGQRRLVSALTGLGLARYGYLHGANG